MRLPKQMLWLFILAAQFGAAFGREEKLVVWYYYLPVDIECVYSGVGKNDIKQHSFFKGSLEGEDAERLLSYSTRKRRDAEFGDGMVRLLVETSDGKTQVWVDMYSVGTDGKTAYVVSPGIFGFLESGLPESRNGIGPTYIPYAKWVKLRNARRWVSENAVVSRPAPVAPVPTK